MTNKLFEVAFTFTPDDETVQGNGVITVSAISAEQARQAVLIHLEEAKDLAITNITEIMTLPDNVLPHGSHDTLQ